MLLVTVTALFAVCGAAKLDRSYLPPPSAATAGGSPGSLQGPLTRSSVQGLETPNLPSGSYANNFGGVVVDAASPGTRASADVGQSNLGGPRQTYGSSNSKVGDAAFRGTAGFRDTSFGSGTNGHSDSGSHSHDHFSNVQNGNGQFSNSQANFENKSERPQAAKDRNSNILALSNDVNPDHYSYGFETDNGIAVGENGVAANGIQAEGGYSYQGDDGQVYKVTYTADEGGYRPQGAHLPTPPPIPEEILKSLEQNAKEEAAGIIDDGSYDAKKYNTEGDYTNDNSGNIQHNGGQLSLFGKRPESTATASSFINQNGQAVQHEFGQSGLDKQNSHLSGQPSQLNAGSGQFGIAATQNSHSTFNGQSSQGNSNSAFGQFNSQAAFNTQSGQINMKPGQFGLTGTQLSGQSSQANNQHETGHLHNTQAFFNGQGQVNGAPNGESSSQPIRGQHSGNVQSLGQNFGNHVLSSSPQGHNTFGGINQFPSQASASAQVHQSPNTQQTQHFNTQFSSETKPSFSQDSGNSQAQPQFGSSFKPQGSEAFSGASLDQEQDNQDYGKPSPQTFSGQNFNRPSHQSAGRSSVDVQTNNFGSGTHNFNRFPQSSSQLSGGKSEYLPPNDGPKQPEQLHSSNGLNFNVGSSSSFAEGSSFNNQKSGNKATPTSIPLNRQTPSIASASASVGQSAFQSQPSRPLNAFNTQTATTQANPNQFTQQATRFVQQNQHSSQIPTQFNSNTQHSGSFAQTQEQSSFGTKPTSIPDTELTTPLEPNETPSYSQGSQISSQTTNSFGSFGSKPISNSQKQTQFGFQGNSAFEQQSSQTLSPSFTSTSLASAQSEASSIGKHPDNSFGKAPQSQNTFSQNQHAGQGINSNKYNQPSKPFDLTGTLSQTSRFPSSPSHQSTGITTQNNFNQQNSFSGNLPGSQSIAPVAPTAASQFAQQPNYNGITQAAISSFPSPSPTPSQTGSAQNNQFGSKHTFSQQAPKPAYNQQATFGSQFQSSVLQQSNPTLPQAGQSSFPSKPVSNFGQRPSSPGSQTQNSFEQSGQMQTQNKPGPSEQASEEKTTVTQQYQGTIYEYNKPAPVLPAPSQSDSSSSQTIQSGIAINKPSFGHPNNQVSAQQTQIGKSGSKSDEHFSKPFGSAPGTQFGQISHSQQSSQFGFQSAPTNNQFSSSAGTQGSQSSLPQQQANVQGSQEPTKPLGFNSQANFSSRPQLNSQTSQFSQNTQAFSSSQTSQPARGPSQSQFGSTSFGNAADGQNNGYFYPNPSAQFPENPQSMKPQSSLDQNPVAQALFSASQQTAQSQLNSNSVPQNGALSTQLEQNSAQFGQKITNSPVQPFGQASSQAVASGQSTASASALAQQPQYKPFAPQNRNQFGLTQNQVHGQNTQQFIAQNPQPDRNSQSADSLRPFGALNLNSGAANTELPKPLFSSACCQGPKDSTSAQSADAPSQTSFQGVQSFNTQSFAGKGEQFGGPRQPAKFDETGYHY